MCKAPFGICYMLDEPVVNNKGTQWENTSNGFLEYVSYQSYEEVVAEVEAINNGSMEFLPTGGKTNIENRTYYIHTS